MYLVSYSFWFLSPRLLKSLHNHAKETKPMQLETFYQPRSEAQTESFSFTRKNASDFAKRIADDFNPIHDIDAKRFCVPGDLLFAVALSKLGLSQKMHITFSDMVGDGVELHLEQRETNLTSICDSSGKTYLSITTDGKHCGDSSKVAALTERYVAFSGTTFPHVLVPLWQQQEVMVNPSRPLVIYESMTLTLNTFDFAKPELELVEPTLSVNGKRGNVCLPFIFKDGDKIFGHGEKRMVISGLKPYDQKAIDDLVEFYHQRKIQLAVNN